MQRCLFLAGLGKGNVFSNPMVGCVIVHDGNIIGEGFHQVFGSAHAEVNAFNAIDSSNLKYLSKSILYVNLEPCCHFGKTPPCTELIIEKGIKKVVIGTLDPNPKVAGKGVKALQDAGIQVIIGICEKECLEFNKLFFEQFNQRATTIKFSLKWAESSDGFMGKEKYPSAKDRELSNALVKRFVHKLRTENDAILIGKNTALIDDPILDNRFWFGKVPTAILIDKRLEVSKDAKVFKSERRVIVFNELKDSLEDNIEYFKTEFNSDSEIFWQGLNIKLVAAGIQSVLIEGGSKTLHSFLNSGLQLEIYRIITPNLWEDGITAPVPQGALRSAYNLGDNRIEIYSS